MKAAGPLPALLPPAVRVDGQPPARSGPGADLAVGSAEVHPAKTSIPPHVHLPGLHGSPGLAGWSSAHALRPPARPRPPRPRPRPTSPAPAPAAPASTTSARQPGRVSVTSASFGGEKSLIANPRRKTHPTFRPLRVPFPVRSPGCHYRSAGGRRRSTPPARHTGCLRTPTLWPRGWRRARHGCSGRCVRPRRRRGPPWAYTFSR